MKLSFQVRSLFSSAWVQMYWTMLLMDIMLVFLPMDKQVNAVFMVLLANITYGAILLYVRKFLRKTNISYLLVCTRMFAYEGVRNVSFSENFAYILNEWSPHRLSVVRNLSFFACRNPIKLLKSRNYIARQES